MSETPKTKGISAQIDPALHQAVREKREAANQTTDEYITLVLRRDVDPDTITITLAADLHSEVEQELLQSGSTMDAFIALALQHELNREDNEMSEPTRTLAFQVPVTLFFRVKDRLAELNMQQGKNEKMTQKDYVLGLITADLDEADRQREAARQQELPPAEFPAPTEEPAPVDENAGRR